MLEHALRDAKVAETCIVKEKQDYKQKLKALRIEVNKLKEDLSEKTTENNEQREEIIRLKQEKSCLHDELIFTGKRNRLKYLNNCMFVTSALCHRLKDVYLP